MTMWVINISFFFSREKPDKCGWIIRRLTLTGFLLFCSVPCPPPRLFRHRFTFWWGPPHLNGRKRHGRKVAAVDDADMPPLFYTASLRACRRIFMSDFCVAVLLFSTRPINANDRVERASLSSTFLGERGSSIPPKETKNVYIAFRKRSFYLNKKLHPRHDQTRWWCSGDPFGEEDAHGFNYQPRGWTLKEKWNYTQIFCWYFQILFFFFSYVSGKFKDSSAPCMR